jgi:predicted metal-dependent RNase
LYFIIIVGLIPVFALGRAQEHVYITRELLGQDES